MPASSVPQPPPIALPGPQAWTSLDGAEKSLSGSGHAQAPGFAPSRVSFAAASLAGLPLRGLRPFCAGSALPALGLRLLQGRAPRPPLRWLRLCAVGSAAGLCPSHGSLRCRAPRASPASPRLRLLSTWACLTRGSAATLWPASLTLASPLHWLQPLTAGSAHR